MIALNTRIGAYGNNAGGDGYFSPPISADNLQLQSPYWVIVARTIFSGESDNLLEINAIPSDVLSSTEPATGTIHVCLQVHLSISDGYEIMSMTFYSDDGNSSLAPNLDIDAESKEGRQGLGLIVNNRESEELWKFEYDRVLFHVCDLSIDNKAICVPSHIKQVMKISSIVNEEDESSLKSELFTMTFVAANSY